jgi:hypothetical protein
MNPSELLEHQITFALALGLYALYTFVGAVIMTVLDHRMSLVRWFDSLPWSEQMIVWMAWPFVAVDYVRRECSP